MVNRITLKRFPKDKYSVIFNPNTGFFARIEDSGCEEPFWASHGPELLDISITGWCDKGCSFCYRKSDLAGSHMSLDDYKVVLEQARAMSVFQVALGGGNPNQHPDFIEILRTTREDFGIVPNYTTNGRGLTNEIIEATKAFCGAVAVSAYSPYRETSMAVRQLSEAGVCTNIHFLLSSQAIPRAIEWLKNPPEWMQFVNAIVFLNYKPVGRFVDEGLLANRSPRLEEFFKLATSGDLAMRIGFDTCTITGLARMGTMPAESIEGCDAGRFSLFVSEKLEVFPCSFMVEAGYKGIPLSDKSLKEIWQGSESFKRIRNQHKGKGCASCTTRKECLGGCPLFPEMNLCPSQCVSQSDS